MSVTMLMKTTTMMTMTTVRNSDGFGPSTDTVE
jgi:hypothetical protein